MTKPKTFVLEKRNNGAFVFINSWSVENFVLNRFILDTLFRPIHNNITSVEQFEISLKSLKEGDRIELKIMRKRK